MSIINFLISKGARLAPSDPKENVAALAARYGHPEYAKKIASLGYGGSSHVREGSALKRQSDERRKKFFAVQEERNKKLRKQAAKRREAIAQEQKRRGFFRCPRCNGSGFLLDAIGLRHDCPTCGGRGVTNQRSVDSWKSWERNKRWGVPSY